MLKKVAFVGLGVSVIFLLSPLASCGPQTHDTAEARTSKRVELCGRGKDLKEATGASKTDQEYYDLVCDQAKAQEGYDALLRKQNGQ